MIYNDFLQPSDMRMYVPSNKKYNNYVPISGKLNKDLYPRRNAVEAEYPVDFLTLNDVRYPEAIAISMPESVPEARAIHLKDLPTEMIAWYQLQPEKVQNDLRVS